jgi:hypothetical protein
MKTIFSLLVLLLFPATVSLCQTDPRTQGREVAHRGEKAETMFMIRQAGLTRDASKVERLLEITREDKNANHVMTAFWALGRIGDPRALSRMEDIDFFIRGTDVRKLVALDKARLLYEQAAQGEKSESIEEAQVRLNVFLGALNLTLPELKQRFDKDAELEIGTRFNGGGYSKYNVLTVREIAGLIFAYRDQHLKTVVEESGLKLSKDIYSEWKIKLAFLSEQERLEMLMAEQGKPLRHPVERTLLNQLLVDMGESAQTAVVRKLDDARQHRDRYSAETIHDYLDIYSHFREGHDRNLVRAFSNDANRRVVEIAKYLDFLIGRNEFVFDFRSLRY